MAFFWRIPTIAWPWAENPDLFRGYSSSTGFSLWVSARAYSKSAACEPYVTPFLSEGFSGALCLPEFLHCPGMRATRAPPRVALQFLIRHDLRGSDQVS